MNSSSNRLRGFVHSGDKFILYGSYSTYCGQLCTEREPLAWPWVPLLANGTFERRQRAMRVLWVQCDKDSDKDSDIISDTCDSMTLLSLSGRERVHVDDGKK